MSPLEEDFEKAVEDIKKIANDLKKTDALQLYGLYKQANFGKNTTLKPSIFNFKGWQKWNAWTAVSELSSDEAKTQYIALVQKIYDKLI
tara:strand:+ start:218 stop:484 length:267 start_codon:yes stop_codon:yes gene_type:complete